MEVVLDYVGLALEAVGDNQLLTASAVLNLVFAVNARWFRLWQLATAIWKTVSDWRKENK